MKHAFVVRFRIALSRLFFVLLIAIAIIGEPRLSGSEHIRGVSSYLGFGLVVVAVLGRLWCSLYLCGYKGQKVIDIGPYSIVRNPLYIFSFLGAVGIGIATTSVLITALLVLFFVVLYPHVIKFEEKSLGHALGQTYHDYQSRTPRLMPDFKLYTGVQAYTVNMRQVHSAFLDVVWFFVALGVARLLPGMHSTDVLPGLFLIP